MSVACVSMRVVVDDQVDSVTVTDASSRYGTFVNGQQLAANTPTALHAHDELQLGGPTCKLVFVAPLNPRAPSQRGSLTCSLASRCRRVMKQARAAPGGPVCVIRGTGCAHGLEGIGGACPYVAPRIFPCLPHATDLSSAPAGFAHLDVAFKSEWDDTCTHLVMTTVQVTPKVGARIRQLRVHARQRLTMSRWSHVDIGR